ncbi:hypothetical protein F0562_014079 [Nyssa sinensis]|uniref:Terpene synthase metal-binding domain-containing protein n=1 Tax=Nyssa sinensis TaxID=561372 RepID=A0A5J4ZRX8_9ASTE|nr:hypothetical protein F0562_014079 [Nyssa sinensis]
MESSLSSIQALANEIKEEMFSTVDLYTFVSPSAYDTAWLAMIPGPPPIGPSHVQGLLGLGLEFIHANLERLLQVNYYRHPRWFTIVFPAMFELAQAAGLEIVLPGELNRDLLTVFLARQRMLEMEELVDEYHYPPLLSYLEALPSACNIDHEDIVLNLSGEGSLFQSPSAYSTSLHGYRKPEVHGLLSVSCSKMPSWRATDLVFSGEYELEDARSFSRKILEKSMARKSINDNLVMFPNFQKVIEHELRLPWIARLNHLDHRMWIEENKENIFRIGKASFYRWSKDWGLTEMGFGREKTTYCYFAVAASSSLPHNSIIRMMVAKSAIIITVADDFFDMEGSQKELQCLTEAVQKWDGKGLSGHGKIIFDVLDNLVSDIAAKYLHDQGSDITKSLRDIKEQEVGKLNLVLLHLKENPEADIEDSIAYVKGILDEKRKQLLKHALMEGFNDLPKQCNHLHLSCLKVFQMFFNSSNLYDSNTDLLQDIMKAIYVPLEDQTLKPLKPPQPLPSLQPQKKENSIIYTRLDRTFRNRGSRTFIRQQFPMTISRASRGNMFIPPKLNLCFI